MYILKSDLVLQELEHVQVDGPGTAYLFFYNKQGYRGLGQVSLLLLMEVWWWSVAASDCRRLRSWVENSAHNTPVGVARESDSSSQLVGSAPQQAGRAPGLGEMTKARLTPIQGLCDCVEGHQSPSALQSAEGFCPLLLQTGEHQTPMDTLCE